MAMTSVAVINFKGGVGKTTLTLCLGRVLAEAGKPPLLFDLDAQMSLTHALSLDRATGQESEAYQKWHQNSESILRVLLKYIDRVRKDKKFDLEPDDDFICTAVPPSHFVPSDPRMYALDLKPSHKEAGRDFMATLTKAVRRYCPQKYEFIFCDCPPNISMLSYSMLHACDIVLVPFNPDFYAMQGLQLFLEFLKRTIDRKQPPFVALVMNRARETGPAGLRTLTSDSERHLRDAISIARNAGQMYEMPVHVLKTYIPDLVGIGNAAVGGIPESRHQTFASIARELQNISARL